MAPSQSAGQRWMAVSVSRPPFDPPAKYEVAGSLP
jgi:hypothetical protein